MGKRFIDTSLWQKEWFMSLSPENKCALMFIMAQCDAVGVWCPNFKLAEVMIGAEIEWLALPNKCHDNIQILNSGKWYLVDFCRYQYGELSESCKPHKSYMKLLESHGLLNVKDKGSTKSIHTLKEKEQEKEQEKDKEKEKEKKILVAACVEMFPEQYQKLKDDFGDEITQLAIDKLSQYKMSSGKTYKSDYHTLLNWVIEQVAGKDKAMVRAEKKLKDEQESARIKRRDEIQSGKLEQRLSLEETQDFIAAIAHEKGKMPKKK